MNASLLTQGRDTSLPTAAREAMGAVLGRGLDLSWYHFGPPQRSGVMTVVPIFGLERTDIAPPSIGAKLGAVRTYGDAELVNEARDRVAIVPLHLGYMQHGAQNHAFCRSAFIAPGKTLRFQDACCVQEAQGGYLAGGERQWFFLLPLALRAEALRLRGKTGYNKLWKEIAGYNHQIGLEQRGHLEQILTRKRAYLTQFQSRFERLEGQTGALFLLEDRLAGIEIAPSAAYFQDIWMPLVCFAYGVAAMYAETKLSPGAPEPFPADSLASLRSALEHSRGERDNAVASWLHNAALSTAQPKRRPEERWEDLHLETRENGGFVGQTVRSDDQLVYASVFAACKIAKVS